MLIFYTFIPHPFPIVYFVLASFADIAPFTGHGHGTYRLVSLYTVLHNFPRFFYLSSMEYMYVMYTLIHFTFLARMLGAKKKRGIRRIRKMEI